MSIAGQAAIDALISLAVLTGIFLVLPGCVIGICKTVQRIIKRIKRKEVTV